MRALAAKDVTMQLDMFVSSPAPEVQEYPYQRRADAKERALISATFGAENLPAIELFLNDVVELYPHKSFVWSGSKIDIYQVIGCAAHCPCCFYMLRDRSIYLIHNFSTYPVGDFPPTLVSIK